jgi:hypothetical protein
MTATPPSTTADTAIACQASRPWTASAPTTKPNLCRCTVPHNVHALTRLPSDLCRTCGGFSNTSRNTWQARQRACERSGRQRGCFSGSPSLRLAVHVNSSNCIVGHHLAVRSCPISVKSGLKRTTHTYHVSASRRSTYVEPMQIQGLCPALPIEPRCPTDE